MGSKAVLALGVLSVLGLAVALAVGLFGTRVPSEAARLTPTAERARPATDLDGILRQLSDPAEHEPSERRAAPSRPVTSAPPRVPNLERVAGLPGERIEGAWPSGGPMFRAQQRWAGGRWELHGAWTSWHENGELEELGGYVAGRENGDWQWWYASGAPLAEGTFDRGRRVGEWRFWHESGASMAEGSYVDGRIEGRWTFRYADGRLHEAASGEYLDGRKVAD